MFSGFRSSNECPVDEEELLQVGTMFRERFESDSNAVSDAHSRDRKYIEELARELRNCAQERGFLQDQLNLRTAEANCMGEHVHSLELKLAEVEKLHEKLRLLRDEVVQCDSQCMLLMQELEHKESELRKSTLLIEKLEAEVSSIALESQCEIESMKLDISALEQRCCDAERFSEQVVQEKARINTMLEEYKTQFQEAQRKITCLEKENKELQEKLAVSEENTKAFFSKVEVHPGERTKNNCRSGLYLHGECDQHFFRKMGFKLPSSKQNGWDENVKDEKDKMFNQVRESERLVSQLKEELRQEKLRAKEEAEDLTQEMAELRYQITDMIEEECKRRACIEQASIQRIQELEAQVLRGQRKTLTAIKHFHEARELAKAKSIEIQHLKNALRGSCRSTNQEISPSCVETCNCGSCVSSRNNLGCPGEEGEEEEDVIVDSEACTTICTGNTSDTSSIGWYPEQTSTVDKTETSCRTWIVDTTERRFL